MPFEPEDVYIRPPANPVEMNEYYMLRDTILRRPLGLPLGQDPEDSASYHLIAWHSPAERVIGTGRLIPREGGLGHIRSMTVHPDYRRLGLGRRLLHSLESEARALGIYLLELEALEGVVPFYLALLYHEQGPVHAPHCPIPHVRMTKRIGDPSNLRCRRKNSGFPFYANLSTSLPGRAAP